MVTRRAGEVRSDVTGKQVVHAGFLQIFHTFGYDSRTNHDLLRLRHCRCTSVIWLWPPFPVDHDSTISVVTCGTKPPRGSSLSLRMISPHLHSPDLAHLSSACRTRRAKTRSRPSRACTRRLTSSPAIRVRGVTGGASHRLGNISGFDARSLFTKKGVKKRQHRGGRNDPISVISSGSGDACRLLLARFLSHEE